jgi:aspartyl protease family protein
MIRKILFLLMVIASVPPCFALQIDVKMLASGSALLQIDGKQRFLRSGARSPEGVLLVSADQQAAVIEWEGKRQTLKLNKQISTVFTQADKAEIRIASGRGGHYVTPGRINGLPVTFMVDTGATMIAMNYLEAQRLGIDYRAGTPINVNTANGVAKAFRVTLNRVAVGDIELHQVSAAVSTTESPGVILLGNSYLSNVVMRIDEGVLLLQAKN